MTYFINSLITKFICFLLLLGQIYLSQNDKLFSQANLQFFKTAQNSPSIINTQTSKQHSIQFLSIEAVISSVDPEFDLYEILQNSKNLKNKYTLEIINLIKTKLGKNLANSLGLKLNITKVGKGQWIGEDGIIQNNPNFEIALTNISQDSDFDERINAFASYLGLALRQDGVGKGQIVHSKGAYEENVVQITFDKNISYEIITALNKAIHSSIKENSDDFGYFLNSSGKSIEIVRYDGKNYSDFIFLVHKLLSDSNYNFGKWQLKQYKKNNELIEKSKYKEHIEKIEGANHNKLAGNQTKQIRKIIYPNSKFYKALEKAIDKINKKYQKLYSKTR